MKTKAFALILATFAVLLFSLFFSPASGKPETADVLPAMLEKSAEDIPVKHVGMGENQPL
jgi:hypothetical protein